MTFLANLLTSMRPKQWTKNGIVFGALIFSQNLFDLAKLIAVCEAFLLFCLTSGTVYLLNDIIDRDKDRQHPQKRLRPIPSGQLSVKTAFMLLIVLGVVGQLLAFWLHPLFFGITFAYMLINAAYSLFLKHVVIIDVLVISLGFVLRAIAGGIVINTEISAWLLVCTFLLALFLALSKRRNELVVFVDSPEQHRRVLMDYSIELLDHLITIVAAATIMAYSLYTFDDRTVQTFETTHLSVTIPFVVYGIFRYLYLIHKKGLGGRPELILLTDKGILTNVLIWLMTSIGVIYFKL
ncbi:MAG: decaprenyl-phosphate phosphoribosyltransferase [Gemmatimonadetes bacterium]|nr:MAG: decaprenyl-phosphate phosphoribosyltransferase [Gemmatimonadota bacterium]